MPPGALPVEVAVPANAAYGEPIAEVEATGVCVPAPVPVAVPDAVAQLLLPSDALSVEVAVPVAGVLAEPAAEVVATDVCVPTPVPVAVRVAVAAAEPGVLADSVAVGGEDAPAEALPEPVGGADDGDAAALGEPDTEPDTEALAAGEKVGGEHIIERSAGWVCCMRYHTLSSAVAAKPIGRLNLAVAAAPLVKPATPAPASVLTLPVNGSKRRTRLPNHSAMYTSPVRGPTRSDTGALNAAKGPTPFEETAVPFPARVRTTGPGALSATARKRWPANSATKRVELSRLSASPHG